MALTENPPDGCGVYFLIREGQIVYVGSSDFPSKRVWSHATCKHKAFDSAMYLAVDEPSQLLEIEKHWIITLHPIHNKQFNPMPSDAHEGWGLSGKEAAKYVLAVPGEYKELVSSLRWATGGVPLGIVSQMALEFFARQFNVPFDYHWTAGVEYHLRRQGARFQDGEGI